MSMDWGVDDNPENYRNDVGFETIDILSEHKQAYEVIEEHFDEVLEFLKDRYPEMMI